MNPFSSSAPSEGFAQSGVLPTRTAPRVTAAGAVILLLGSLVLGVLLGTLYSFVAQWMDLVILFPLGFGLLLGALLAIPIYTAKIRVRFLVVVCAILASAFLMGARIFGDSLQAREAMISNARNGWYVGKTTRTHGKMTTLTGDEIEQRLRLRFSPLRFFKLYLQSAGQTGAAIGDVGKSPRSTDLNLSGGWFWGFEAMNFALIAAMAIAASLHYASAPFCEECRRWLGNAQEITKVHPHQSAELVEKLRRRDWEGAAGIVGKNVSDQKQSVLSAASCPACGQAQLKVKTTGGALPKTDLEMPVSADDVARLQKARAQRL
jgi:hypothetical protein